MAGRLDEAEFQALRELAAPLLKKAVQVANVMVHEGASQDEIAAAQFVQGLTAAMQALMQVAPLGELGQIVALGATCGSFLGQCDADRNALYRMFQHQFTATLKEIAEAMPALAPAQGHA